MQINFFGANCLSLKLPQVSLVFDDNLQDLGGRAVTTPKDILCLTDTQLVSSAPEARFVFDTPGDYEVQDVLIHGIAASGLNETSSLMQSTIFKVLAEDLVLVVSGHIKPDLNDTQLETLGEVDILFVPVGGGETLDATLASQLVKALSPKLVIPTHYQQPGLEYKVAQASYEDFAKQLGVIPEIEKETLKLKKKDLSEKLRLMILA